MLCQAARNNTGPDLISLPLTILRPENALDFPPSTRLHRAGSFHRTARGVGASSTVGVANVQSSRIWNVGEPEKGVGQRFESSDGSAVLSIYSSENEAADTPASYLRKNLRQSGLDYQRVTRSFFAISMERDGRIYYSRCNCSRSAKRSIHCFDLLYPQEEKLAWDPVVTRISLSLRPLER